MKPQLPETRAVDLQRRSCGEGLQLTPDVRAAGAIDHFAKYMQLAPKADDVPAIRQRMAELEPGTTK